MTDRRVSRANRNQKLRGRSWVYFAQEGIAGLVKIGQTRQLSRRISVLNSATAGGVKLIGAIPEIDLHEKRVHWLFAQFRERGEWFRPEPDVLRLAAAGEAIYANGYCHEVPDELADEAMIIRCAGYGALPYEFLRDLGEIRASLQARTTDGEASHDR